MQTAGNYIQNHASKVFKTFDGPRNFVFIASVIKSRRLDQAASPNTGIEGIIQPRNLNLLETLDLHGLQFRLALTWINGAFGTH